MTISCKPNHPLNHRYKQKPPLRWDSTKFRPIQSIAFERPSHNGTMRMNKDNLSAASERWWLCPSVARRVFRVLNSFDPYRNTWNAYAFWPAFPASPWRCWTGLAHKESPWLGGDLMVSYVWRGFRAHSSERIAIGRVLYTSSWRAERARGAAPRLYVSTAFATSLHGKCFVRGGDTHRQ